MSRTQFRTSLYREIQKLNERIDWKIVRGYAYRDEARRHRELLGQIARLNRSAQWRVQVSGNSRRPTFMTRALEYLALF